MRASRVLISETPFAGKTDPSVFTAPSHPPREGSDLEDGEMQEDFCSVSSSSSDDAGDCASLEGEGHVSSPSPPGELSVINLGPPRGFSKISSSARGSPARKDDGTLNTQNSNDQPFLNERQVGKSISGPETVSGPQPTQPALNCTIVVVSPKPNSQSLTSNPKNIQPEPNLENEPKQWNSLFDSSEPYLTLTFHKPESTTHDQYLVSFTKFMIWSISCFFCFRRVRYILIFKKHVHVYMI